jgi:hypothetical protein
VSTANQVTNVPMQTTRHGALIRAPMLQAIGKGSRWRVLQQMARAAADGACCSRWCVLARVSSTCKARFSDRYDSSNGSCAPAQTPCVARPRHMCSWIVWWCCSLPHALTRSCWRPSRRWAGCRATGCESDFGMADSSPRTAVQLRIVTCSAALPAGRSPIDCHHISHATLARPLETRQNLVEEEREGWARIPYSRIQNQPNDESGEPCAHAKSVVGTRMPTYVKREHEQYQHHVAKQLVQEWVLHPVTEVCPVGCVSRLLQGSTDLDL